MAHKTLTKPRTPAAYTTLARQVQALDAAGQTDAADRLAQWVEWQLDSVWESDEDLAMGRRRHDKRACIDAWQRGICG